MKISIIGTSITKFGELWDKSLLDLSEEAVTQALTDSNLAPEDIEAVFVGNMGSHFFDGQAQVGALISGLFPQYPPAFHMEGACASGGLALLNAEYALLSGRYKTVLVLGVEKMTDAPVQEVTQMLSGASKKSQEPGSTFPALYALLTQLHMKKFGTTREMLSTIAVQNHEHAFRNASAQFHKHITAQDVEHSALVAPPLHVLDCSPITDGAAAVVLTTKKTPGHPVILGRGHSQDSLDLASRKHLTQFDSTIQAAHQAFTESGLSPKHIQTAEVHDCFTIGQILALEDLGFFEKGKAGSAVLDEQTTWGSALVINPSGGLKASGHPVGATGVKQLAYITSLVKEDQFHYALTQNVGGSGATCVIHVVGKER